MNEIKIEVWDATGNKRQLVEVPTDAEVNRLIAVLIDRMNLPRHSPDGQMMSYKFGAAIARLRHARLGERERGRYLASAARNHRRHSLRAP